MKNIKFNILNLGLACCLLSASNTKGGLLFDGRHRVLTWEGKPIPRLYTVGEISSVLKFVYQGGGNLTECLVYGRSVGKEVAGLPNLKA